MQLDIKVINIPGLDGTNSLNGQLTTVTVFLEPDCDPRKRFQLNVLGRLPTREEWDIIGSKLISLTQPQGVMPPLLIQPLKHEGCLYLPDSATTQYCLPPTQPTETD